MKILVACSGSVATIKLPKLLVQLKNRLPEGGVVGGGIANHFIMVSFAELCKEAKPLVEAEIKVIMTKYSQQFSEIPKENSDTHVKYYTDEDEWESWSRNKDVLHIELGKWADLMVIAPLSANSLAKIAGGICDNLMTCTARAWDTKKPLLFAPAMNTRMLEHPVTRPQIDTLIGWGYEEIPTVEKLLACGDKGDGAMAEVETIVEILVQRLGIATQSTDD